MKLVFADNTELELVNANESYKIGSRDGAENAQILSVGFASGETLETIKAGITAEKLACLKLVTEAGTQEYNQVQLVSLSRTFSDKDILCYATFKI